MPAYDYSCPKCGKTVEIIKPIARLHDEEKCENCGTVLVKELSAPPFHLKGSGWYVTDYKNSKKDTKKDED